MIAEIIPLLAMPFAEAFATMNVHQVAQAYPRLSTSVSRPGGSSIKRCAAFVVVQVNELLQESHKNLLLFPVQRLKQAAGENGAAGNEFFQEGSPFRSQMKQAKAFALHRHHPADKSPLLQSHCKIGGGGSVEGTQFRQRDLINPRMLLKNTQHAILDRGYTIAHGGVKQRNRYLLSAPN